MRKTDSTAHTIRFPMELYQFIRGKAVVEHRTFNAQVLHYIIVGVETSYPQVTQAAKEENHEEQ